MIWNQHLLYQIIDVWYHIRKLYLINKEKNDKIKLNHFCYKRRPIVIPGNLGIIFTGDTQYPPFESGASQCCLRFSPKEQALDKIFGAKHPGFFLFDLFGKLSGLWKWCLCRITCIFTSNIEHPTPKPSVMKMHWSFYMTDVLFFFEFL